MKKNQEIIILSDLWGANRSSWLINFQKNLAPHYAVKFYDACALGEIDLTNYNQENIHRQFIDFGIQKAVGQLLELEQEPKIYMGCSVGGVILWKAGLEGLPIQKLITISATRLRKETKKPSCPLELYFGANDPFQPKENWFQKMKINGHFIPGGDHDIYKDPFVVEKILRQSNLI